MKLLPNHEQLILLLSCLFLMAVCTNISRFWWSELKTKQVVPIDIHTPVAPHHDNQPKALSHIFGSSEILENAAMANPDLKLVGILSSTVSETASAIIALSGEAGKIYHIGDHVPGGMKVIAINDDLVILNAGDHQAQLTLPKPKPFAKDGTTQ